MSRNIVRKRVLKFRDFPTRYHRDAFFVESGYDEKLNISIINHLVEIQQLFNEKYIHFYYFPFLAPKIKKAAPYCYPALNKEDLDFAVPSDFLLPLLTDEKYFMEKRLLQLGCRSLFVILHSKIEMCN